ncbi:hypothetical protein BD413DRAFT_637146 [Trametes elegans]|nr:hypothetical protein BD413DRAFT_637146 [Trametes elegans]
MFSKLVSLAALAAVANAEHWIFGGSKLIAQTRLDSIVNPGALGTHVHAIVGASGFKNTYDPDDLVQSKCTTIPVQPDKSNYWSEQMYHQDQQTKKLTPIPTTFNIYYLVRNGPKNEKIHAFPKGLKMLAGDTTRRTYNASNFADQAVSYVCLDYSGSHGSDPAWAERPDFFEHSCPDGMRAQSHMAYPIQNYNSGDCPDSHPVHLVSLFYEMLVSVDQFPYWGAGSWVLANGDTTGLGHHGDFQNGWDIDLLQEAIDTCTNANGNVMDCPALAAKFDQAAADACVLETSIVNEDIGLTAPISALPGCNPIYNGKPAGPCPQASNPDIVPAQQPLPSGWTELGCIAEGTSGRALPALTMKNANMTKAMCASYCGSQGYKLAGVEFSDECYCDNSVKNGASTNLLAWDQCNNHCAGNNYEICGGAAKLSLLSTGNPGASAPSSSASSVSSAAPRPVSSANTASSISSSATPAHTSAAGTTSASSAGTTSSAASHVLIPVSSAVPSASSSSIISSSSSSIISSSTSAAQPSASSSVPSGSNSTAAPGLPSGWSAAGCAADVPARTLNVDAFTSEQMTVGACVAHCAALGHTLAGLEYARECYCGRAFVNGGGAPLAAAQCDMACTGDAGTVCGGHMALSVFQHTGPAAPVHNRRGHKARHFGRAHAHSDLF